MTTPVYKRTKSVSPVIAQSSVAGVMAGMLVMGTSFAAGQVSSLQTLTQDATPFVYSAGGIEYQWGMGQNQLLEGFVTDDGQAYTYAVAADRVELMRDDIVGVTTGEPCGIFVERLSYAAQQRTFSADYPSDGSGTGNCDIASMLSSRVVNRGAVDLFSNTLPDAKNIERLDYVFDSGVLAPLTQEAMQLAGHLASEKSSNNPIKIAAILSVDILGKPSAYGPLQLVGANGCSHPDLCYGITDLQHTYSFLQNDFNRPQSFPVETERSQESVGMAFVSVADLGLNPGQTYYGFSFFADDVEVAAGHNLIDPSTFPDDTSDENVVTGDDADVYGGLSGYFLADSLTVAAGAVFNDIDGDGVRDTGEAGISDIRITLIEDVNGNGVLDAGEDLPLGDSIDTNLNGDFVLPGIPEGNFLVVLDESDPELLPGLVASSGSNPRVLTISGADPEPVFFPFVDPLTISFQDEADGSSGAGADVDDSNSGTSDSPASGFPSGGSSNADSGGALGGDADSDANGDTPGSGTSSGNEEGGSGEGTDTTSSNGTNGTTGAGSPLSPIGSSDTESVGAGEIAGGGTSEGSAEDSEDAGTGSGSGGGIDSSTSGSANDTPGSTGSGASVDGTDSAPGSGSPDEDSVQQSTLAVNDNFSINQGDSDSLDVLANDIDGAGGGLTLTSVSSSTNASISIVNNEVAYQPNFGFYGVDTFLYTFVDTGGIQLTGNVRVDVLRFSDINNNTRNDYEECACTDLTLQTGVNGAGVGQLSLIGILVMMIGVCLRRRSIIGLLKHQSNELVKGANR